MTRGYEKSRRTRRHPYRREQTRPVEGEHSNETETMEAQAETMQTEAIETDAKDMASGTETIPMESETESDSDALAIGEIAGDDTSLTEQSKDQEEQMKEFWIILTRSESRKEKLTWTLFQDHYNGKFPVSDRTRSRSGSVSSYRTYKVQRTKSPDTPIRRPVSFDFRNLFWNDLQAPWKDIMNVMVKPDVVDRPPIENGKSLSPIHYSLWQVHNRLIKYKNTGIEIHRSDASVAMCCTLNLEGNEIGDGFERVVYLTPQGYQTPTTQ
ncbi:hypothetical protein B0O80DRAFT_495215 [Mortierella sp. GBAus27b]|nr:hypothetical protein B0O80DRAFT_495215 [Mortierella sp. GBAus27b]